MLQLVLLSSTSNTLYAFLFLISLYVTWSTVRRKSNTSYIPLPPGPRPWPVIGNALQLPTKNQHIKYSEWRKIYGDIIHLSVFGAHIVILNSAQATFDLLEKRGKIYSDRPSSVMSELVGFDKTWAFLNYGDRLRQIRRLAHQQMNARAIEKYHLIQEEEARFFAQSVLAFSEDLNQHVNRATSTITLRFLYGLSPSSELDELSVAAQSLVDDAKEILGSGSGLLELFPFLKYIPRWFPGASFKCEAARLRELMRYVHGTPFEMVRQNMVSGAASSSSSLCETLLREDVDDQPPNPDLVRNLLGSAYPPGQETMASTLNMFFILMAIHPEVQHKAQAEITAVIGDHRLPVVSDRTHLPYLNAILKEVLRMESVVPLGIPHQLAEDDEYNGYRLPKGTIVFQNVWEMMHDPLVYPDPHLFRPERFIGTESKTDSGLPYSPFSFVFGFGRRLCPGLHFAEASLLITMATILATCHITQSRDSHCSDVPFKAEFTSGLVIHPSPFKCSIKPQSENASNLLRHAIDGTRP